MRGILPWAVLAFSCLGGCADPPSPVLDAGALDGGGPDGPALDVSVVEIGTADTGADGGATDVSADPCPGGCDDGDLCTIDSCESAGCVHVVIDADADGHSPRSCGGDDCDDADGGIAPGESEVCDGVDQDCDDAVDDGIADQSCGVGACATTAPGCAGGVVPTCSPLPSSAETCNLLDDDCDGSVDDGFSDQSCGVGACATTVAGCVDGIVPICVPLSPSPESCNLVDDDCDGSVDDGIADQTCGLGACAATAPGCVGGSIPTCTPLPPSVETCNAIDDDCDGTPDDGIAAQTCGVGACARTVPGCTGGVVPACTPGAPSTELCGNAIDDDCDGAIDEPLERVGADVRVTNAARESWSPALVWTGTEYGVTWADARTAVQREVYFRRLSTTGALLGSEAVIGPMTGNIDVRMAWSGAEYLVLWNRYDGTDWQARYSRVSAAGVEIGTEANLAPGTFTRAQMADVVWTGSEHAVVFIGMTTALPHHAVYLARRTATGASAAAPVRITTPSTTARCAPYCQRYPDVVWNGTELLVSWEDQRNGDATSTRDAVFLERVSLAGAITLAEAALSDPTTRSAPHQLGWSGTELGVTWTDTGPIPTQVFSTRASAMGVELGAERRVSEPARGGSGSAIAPAPGGWLVAWTDATDFRLRLATVDAAGVVSTPIVVSTARSHQPSIVWTGTEHALSWSDGRDGNDEIYFSRWAPGCS